ITALNFAVAAVTAAPAAANIVSFLFVRLAHGRHKVRAVNALQVGMALVAACIAFAPKSLLGLGMAVACGVLARMCYAGIVTLRSAIWRANYPRHTRARLTGKIAAIQTLITAGVGVAIGQLLQLDEAWLRIVIPTSAAFSLIGVVLWSRLRVRGHAALLKAERGAEGADRPSFNPAQMVSILIKDPRYALFMLAQFIMGTGNMMTFAVIVIITQERFDLGYRDAMLVTQVLPYIMIPLLVGPWSMLLDRWHIVQYRAVHSWVFVVMALVFAAAVHLETAALLYVAAILRGIGFSGGALAWNLGHNDFATDKNAPQYMAVHVTLTGVRGLVAPFLGVALYQYFETQTTLGGAALFILAGILIAIGAAIFGYMAVGKKADRLP
ncbi:MAG: MFS transporter, partial [Planctomycetota bacterium]